MNPIISVRDLSKIYRIPLIEKRRYRTLRDDLAETTQRFWKRKLFQSQTQEFWALRDISFDIYPGEVIGIIGRNGSGKSTLLKILSRITLPTQGEAFLQGRVGSLLEVGTGFHPELTGRENIYLSGAILGMSRNEIKKKFDEIVAFAEVEKFLDMPVKRYSSGMYVRLAFSVAAHLEPEILLVDEVLAVGDIQFQKKCLGKMGEVANGGRTVLFVSHQMNTIRKLCDQCIWLNLGTTQMIGPTLSVVSGYESALLSHSSEVRKGNQTKSSARFVKWKIVDSLLDKPNWLTTFGSITLEITLEVNQPILDGMHGIALFNSDNQLMWAWSAYNLEFKSGVYELLYHLPNLPLRPGVYYWQVSLYDMGELIDLWNCVPEMVIATEPLTHIRDEWTGVLNIPCNFEVMDKNSV